MGKNDATYYGGGVTISVTGIDKLLGQLQRMTGASDRASKNGFRRGARTMLAASQQLVPVDTGALQASASVEENDDELRIVYKEPYAAIVHEKMSLKHPDGQAKYLEQAVNEGLDAMTEELGAALNEELDSAL